MISHILVVDPSGVCIVDRNYGDIQTDPILISGFLAAVVPRIKTLKFDHEKINQQLNERSDSLFEAIKQKRWIIAGFSDRDVSRSELIYVLHEVASLVVPKLGRPKGYSYMLDSEIDKLSNEIDSLIERKRENLQIFMKEDKRLSNRVKRKFGLKRR